MLIYKKHFYQALGLSALTALLSCKAVRSGKHNNNASGNSPIVEPSGNLDPAAPPTVPPPQSETPVVPGATTGTPPAGTSVPVIPFVPEPSPPEAVPALTKPDALQIFALRSIPIEQNGLVARQYRVDLGTRSVGLDELANDQWKLKIEYKLNEDQLQKVKALMAGLKVGTYPTCNPCKREGHTILIEGLENNKKALSYAMSEPCTCGGNDERKATVSFANLKQLTEILNK